MLFYESLLRNQLWWQVQRFSQPLKLNQLLHQLSYLWTYVWANLWANIRTNSWANLWTNLWANLWTQLWANSWANVWTNLWVYLSAHLWQTYKPTYEPTYVPTYGNQKLFFGGESKLFKDRMYLLTVLSFLFLLKFNFRCGFWQLTQQMSDVLFKMSLKFQLFIILRVIYVILSMQKKQDGNRKFFLFESQHMSPRMSQLMNQLMSQRMNLLMSQLMSQPMNLLMSQLMGQLLSSLIHQLMRQHLVNSLIPQAFVLLGSRVIAEKNLKTDSPFCFVDANECILGCLEL